MVRRWGQFRYCEINNITSCASSGEAQLISFPFGITNIHPSLETSQDLCAYHCVRTGVLLSIGISSVSCYSLPFSRFDIIKKADHLYVGHTLSLTSLSKAVAVIPSPEAMLRRNNRERKCFRRLMTRAMESCPTEMRCRCLWLCHVDGLMKKEIALVENVQQQDLSESIQVARKNVQTFFMRDGWHCYIAKYP